MPSIPREKNTVGRRENTGRESEIFLFFIFSVLLSFLCVALCPTGPMSTEGRAALGGGGGRGVWGEVCVRARSCAEGRAALEGGGGGEVCVCVLVTKSVCVFISDQVTSPHQVL